MAYLICTINNIAACLCFPAFHTTRYGRVHCTYVRIYLIGFSGNAGLRPAKAFSFCIQMYNVIYRYGLLLEIGFVTSYNSMPISLPFTEVQDSNQSL